MARKYLVLLFFIIVAFAQCTQKEIQYYAQNDLPSSFYTIDINRDTVIHTTKGALINIPKGSLDAGDAVTVKLEVKEAYTIADMITAGLTTRAGKQVLSSGGMICVTPIDKKVSIKQALSVSIPTTTQVDSMKLYKGKVNGDSTIDWTDPQPLPEQALSKHLQNGKVLYMSNCASCHHPLKDQTGPALAYLYQRRDHKWLGDFVRNSAKMIYDGDPQANCLYERYNRAAMTAFPTISDEELKAIFDYADFASNVPASAVPDYQAAFDSCQVYNKAKAAIIANRDRLIAGNKKMIEYIIPPNAIIDTHLFVAPEGYEDKTFVVPAADDAMYYNFKISAFGWYNIDMLTSKMPGAENSQLNVTLTGDIKEHINLFLVIPDKKIFIAGGLLAGKNDEYGFFADDGTIPLPQGQQAYILALGEYDGKPYYGITSFVTSNSQSLEIRAAASTKKKIDKAIARLDIEGLSVKTEDAKNADSVRITDKQLKDVEYLKPHGFDCNCGSRGEMSDSSIYK